MELTIHPLTDYLFYARSEYWTSGEACSLTLGLDPKHVQTVADDILAEKLVSDPYPAVFADILEVEELIRRSVDAGSLRIIRYQNPYDVWTGSMAHYLLGWNEYHILPLDFIQWAESKGLSLPTGLLKAVRNLQDLLANKEQTDPTILSSDMQAKAYNKVRKNAFTTSGNERFLNKVDVHEFVKSLKFEVENDSEITIQEPGKQPMHYRYLNFGFKNENVRTWRRLIDTLENEPHMIRLSPQEPPKKSDSSEYRRNWKVLFRLNKALVDFFSKEFKMAIPSDYKFYERYKPAGAGVYVLEFKEPLTAKSRRSHFNSMQKNRLLKEIRRLASERSSAFEDADTENLALACRVARDKKWMTEEEIRMLLEETKDVKEFFYEDQSKYPQSAK